MDFDILKKLTISRQSIREFSKRQLERGDLEEILGYALRTPTSMNLQPYRLIVVRDSEKKEDLAECMSDQNARVVSEAAASIIVCSDIDPIKCIDDFGIFAYKEDGKVKMKRLSVYARAKYSFNTFSSIIFGWVIRVAGFFIRLFRPFTDRISMQAWTNQQSAFLIQNICLLSEAKGLSSIIMGGYSETKLREVFKIPTRFQVSAVVSIGYKKEVTDLPVRCRLPLSTVCFFVIL